MLFYDTVNTLHTLVRLALLKLWRGYYHPPAFFYTHSHGWGGVGWGWAENRKGRGCKCFLIGVIKNPSGWTWSSASLANSQQIQERSKLMV